MFDVSKIKSSLGGLVGWKQPFNPAYAIVDANNQLSESGYFVNDNPYAKIELIKDSQDYQEVSDADFNTILSDIINRATINICNQVFSKVSYIDRQVLYRNALNKIETENLPNGFIGFRIEIDDTKSVSFKITRLFCDFEGTGTFTIYLFNSSKKEPIKQQEVTINSDHVEVALNWNLDDTESIYKGEYYIGYIKDETLTVTPYKRDFEDSNVMSYVTHLSIDKVIVPNHSTATLFDLSKVNYLSDTTGLNLDITVNNDYTDLIIQNKHLFSRAIYLLSVINTLQIYMTSIRSSRNEKLSKDMYNKLLIEIEGTRSEDSVISVKGLRPQLLTEISTIKSEIEKLQEGYFGTGWEVITEL